MAGGSAGAVRIENVGAARCAIAGGKGEAAVGVEVAGRAGACAAERDGGLFALRVVGAVGSAAAAAHAGAIGAALAAAAVTIREAGDTGAGDGVQQRCKEGAVGLCQGTGGRDAGGGGVVADLAREFAVGAALNGAVVAGAADAGATGAEADPNIAVAAGGQRGAVQACGAATGG